MRSLPPWATPTTPQIGDGVSNARFCGQISKPMFP